MAAKNVGYKMHASGYGTKTYKYATKEEAEKQMRHDAACTADELDGEVQDYGGEVVVYGRKDGDEIARFQLI